MTGPETLRAIFDQKKISILQAFVQKPEDEFTQQELSRKTRVPIATVHRVLKVLVAANVVQKVTRKHLSTFQLSPSQEAQFMTKLLYEKPAPIAKFVDSISSLPGIQMVMMHGKADDSRANVVIIGTNVNKDVINAQVAIIKEDENFTIGHLILEPEQFEMLESMGQFSGTKTVLFSR